MMEDYKLEDDGWMCAVVGCAVMFPWYHQCCPALNGRRSAY